MQQVVDLQNSKDFQALDVELLSISPDPPQAWATEASSLGIRTPLLSDVGNRVANTYGVMRWGMASDEPGHTFVLVDRDGRLSWVKDYGAPEHGGLMYVSPQDLVPLVAYQLAASSP
jgi:peroxiredoxin